MVAAIDTVALGFMLSSGEAGDAPQGRALLEKMGPQDEVIALLMDRAYESDETRALAILLGWNPVVMFLAYFTFALIVDALCAC